MRCKPSSCSKKRRRRYKSFGRGGGTSTQNRSSALQISCAIRTRGEACGGAASERCGPPRSGGFGPPRSARCYLRSADRCEAEPCRKPCRPPHLRAIRHSDCRPPRRRTIRHPPTSERLPRNRRRRLPYFPTEALARLAIAEAKTKSFRLRLSLWRMSAFEPSHSLRPWWM